MIKFLVYRCLKWIPTFIAILLCTFLLCINVPGNENIQEDELSASSASSTIIPSQLKQGLFYFVFQTANWDQQIYDISYYENKPLANLLLEYSGDINAVHSTLHSLQQTEITLTQKYVNELITVDAFKKDIQILKSLSKLQQFPISAGRVSTKILKSKIDELNRFQFHENAWRRNLPSIYWLGSSNVFNEWLVHLIAGNWGYSQVNNAEVLDLVTEAFTNTLLLAIVALIIALLAIPLSIQLYHSSSRWSRLITTVLRVMIVIPKFIWALIFIFLLANVFHWMNPLIFKQIDRGFSDNYLWYIIPAMAMILPFIGYLQDQINQQIEVEFRKDYVNTALAKGMTKKQVLYGHVLKNSLFPFITTFTHLIPTLLGGSVLVERIFGLPGLGDLLIESVFNRDFQVVVGITLFVSLIISFSYLLGDILYQIFNPKVKFE